MRGLTLESLAAKIHKGRSAISKYERGEIVLDIETLCEIAKALRVRPEQLLCPGPGETPRNSGATPPAFFNGITRFYSYLFDGRSSRLTRCLFDTMGERVALYMNFRTYGAFQNCENTYWGRMEHYDAVTAIQLQTPYFSPLRDCIEGAGCRFLENPMLLEKGRYELDFADFEAKIKAFRPAVFLLVNPQNPTGRVFTREELERMVSICAENHVLILSDEVHFLITFDGKKHIPILSVSEQARKISFQVFSLSKGFNIMSLPHAMILISDPRLREQWLSFLKPFNFHYASNSFSIAAVTAVTSGGADRWLEECTACLQQNRDLFLRLVREKALSITPLPPEAGYLLWIDCRQSGILPEELDRVLLEEAGLGVNNGLGHGEAGRGFIRLNFGVTESNLRLAVERLEALFRRRTEKQKR